MFPKFFGWVVLNEPTQGYFHPDMKCFHIVVQGTHKIVLISCINFEDHALIKRQRADKKMNATSERFKDEKNGVTIESSLHLLLEVVRIFKILEFTTS
jgi:hypothetical protein